MNEKSTKNLERAYLGALTAVSVFLSFTMFIFAQTDIYIANITYLDFKLVDIFGLCILFFALCMVLIWSIGYLLRGKKIAWISLGCLFACGLCLYIQGNFLAGGYPVLTGEIIEWGSMTARGVVNTIFWVVVFAVLVFIAYKYKKYLAKIVIFGSIFVLTVELVTMITLVATTDFDNALTHSYLSKDHMFELSEEKNIITFISDTFEETYFTRALEEYPELAKDLEDFTFYQNTSGISCFTYLSTSVLYTGEVFPVGMDRRSGTDFCYDQSTFFDTMQSNGYDINYYTYLNLLSENNIGIINNYENDNNKKINLKASYYYMDYLMGIVAYKYAPHFLKQYIPVQYSTSYIHSFLDLNNYAVEDATFRDDLISKGVTTSGALNKQYIVYHLEGLHAPNNRDRNFDTVEYANDVSADDRRYEEALAQINLLKEYIKQLKASGAYDNTTIIFTADHGHDLRYDTVLLIKPTNAHCEFSVSQAPISLLSDYTDFIIDLAEGKGDEAGLYNIPEDISRERFVYGYIIEPYGSPSEVRTKILIGGRANESEKYQIISDEFDENDSGRQPYSLGTEVLVSPSCPDVSFYGFWNSGCTYSESAVIEASINQTVTSDLQVTLAMSEVADDNQHVTIRAGDTIVYDEDVPAGTKELTFCVSLSLLDNNVLRLTFMFPNAVYTTDNSEGLLNTPYDSINFDSFVIDSAEAPR